jgi:hypothetical protein
MVQTSGDSSWVYTQQQFINAAFRKIGVFDKTQTPDTFDQNAAAEALNNIIFSLEAIGMPVWAMTTTYFTLTQGQYAYPVGLGVGTGNLNIAAPLKVTQAWNLDVTDPNNTYRIPMNIYTQYNYNLLNAPNDQGYPIQFWYQPGNQQGTINIWPAPDAVSAMYRQIWFVYQRPFSQFDATTDTLDFPQVWIEPVIYSLAHRLSPEYGLPLAEQDKLNETANQLITNALSFGTEEGALFIQPDWVVMGMGQGNPNGY